MLEIQIMLLAIIILMAFHFNYLHRQLTKVLITIEELEAWHEE